jgi:hypothetical protein
VASELAEETTAPDNLTEEEQGKSSLAWSRSVFRISSIDTRPYYYYMTQYLTDRRAFLRCPWDKAYIRWTELVLLRKYWRQKHHWMGGGAAGLCGFTSMYKWSSRMHEAPAWCALSIVGVKIQLTCHNVTPLYTSFCRFAYSGMQTWWLNCALGWTFFPQLQFWHHCLKK